jgi:thiol-disulfide isomerase/thioredoxin
MRRVLVLALTLALAVMAAGCDPQPPEVRASAAPPPFLGCPAGDAAAGSARPGGQTPPGAAEKVPAVTLPCFTDGAPIALARLGRPAVINLWASWCAPCRAELPEFQRLADLAGNKIIVLGVVTGDRRSAAASLASDLGLSFPALFDESGQLGRDLATPALPVTLLVDADGGLRHVDKSGALTLAALRELASTHLGVVVS